MCGYNELGSRKKVRLIAASSLTLNWVLIWEDIQKCGLTNGWKKGRASGTGSQVSFGLGKAWLILTSQRGFHGVPVHTELGMRKTLD